MIRLAIAFSYCAAASAQPFLLTSFRGNGGTGVSFTLSEDGYRWTPVRRDQPVVPPRMSGMLMRDPFLVGGPDGR
ncbi:MAG: hypothetical protein ACUVS7_15640 [Bryobacteraceae bacterium]